jgi:hypothetical protein
MPKKTQYFSHDFGARNDPKIQNVLMELGQEGKGVYWDLVEMLYEQGGYLNINEYKIYAFALRTHSDCIASLVNNFGLFQKDDKYFWSDSVLRRLDLMINKSTQAKESAKIRWENANALKNDADAMRSVYKSDANKEINKIKEKKDNKVNKDIPSLPAASDEIYPKCIAIYDAFIQKHTGVKAKINGVTGASMKRIIKYLKEQVKNKENLKHEVPFSFQLILDNFDRWLPFHRQQLNLNQIESNLINIITAIKNGVPTNNTNQYQRSKYAPQQ